MQYSVEYAGYAEYAEEFTADGAYNCPVGSIRPFLYPDYMVLGLTNVIFGRQPTIRITSSRII